MLAISLIFMSLAAFSAGEVDPHIQAMYETMPRDEFVEYFNSLGLTYKISQRTTPFVPGVVLNHELRENLTVIQHIKPDDLPDNFDARQKWPNCVTLREIYKQGHCGSCWTFGTATSASDRYCTLKNMTIRLSEQDFDCFTTDVCGGGDPAQAFQYWIDTGLVTQECKPYDIPALKQNICETTCKNGKNYQADKHRGSSQSRLQAKEDTIMTELFKNGPIQAAFTVYADFRHYAGGIYTHTYGVELGGHSVRVIGYGVENGVKYWLGANSWGTDWGENGYFKIKRWIDVGFERYLIAGLP